MKVEERKHLIMGGTSIIIILSTFIIGVLIVLMVSNVYETYKVNQDYVADTLAYYTADGEATVKRALIEEKLYRLYYSKVNLKYDVLNIMRVIKNIKNLEVINQDENSLIMKYKVPINQEEDLVVELEVSEMENGLEVKRFTKVLKWRVE